MNKVLKNVLNLSGIYVICSILTIIIFYTFGWYVWNQAPTNVVLVRMIILSVILSIISIIIAFNIKRIKK